MGLSAHFSRILRYGVVRAVLSPLMLAFALALPMFYAGQSLQPTPNAGIYNTYHCNSPSGVKHASLCFLPSDNTITGLAEARECFFSGNITTVLESLKLIRTVFIENTVHQLLKKEFWCSTLTYHFSLPPGWTPSITISYRRLVI